jgi:hypothetical protein
MDPVPLIAGHQAAGTPHLFTHSFQAKPFSCSRWVAPIVLASISLTTRCTNMWVGNETDTIELVLTAFGCDQAVVRHKSRLFSDNGSCYISGDLAEWLEKQGMTHVRKALFDPQTQGNTECSHEIINKRVFLEN